MHITPPSLCRLLKDYILDAVAEGWESVRVHKHTQKHLCEPASIIIDAVDEGWESVRMHTHTHTYLCEPASISSCLSRSCFSAPAALSVAASMWERLPTSTACMASGSTAVSSSAPALTVSDFRCNQEELRAAVMGSRCWPPTHSVGQAQSVEDQRS